MGYQYSDGSRDFVTLAMDGLDSMGKSDGSYRADVARERAKMKEAVQEFSQQAEPAFAYYKNGDYSNAITEFKNVLKHPSRDKMGYYGAGIERKIYLLIAQSYVGLKDEKNALEAYYDCGDFNPDFKDKSDLEINAEKFFTDRGLKIPQNKLRAPWKTVFRICGAGLIFGFMAVPLIFNFSIGMLIGALVLMVIAWIFLPSFMRKRFRKLRIAGIRGKESNLAGIVVTIITIMYFLIVVSSNVAMAVDAYSGQATVQKTQKEATYAVGDTVIVTEGVRLRNDSFDKTTIKYLSAGDTLTITGESITRKRSFDTSFKALKYWPVEQDGVKGFVSATYIKKK